MSKVQKEDIKSLGQLEVVVPAKGLLDAIIDSADALAKQPIDEERARNLKLVLGFLNAFTRAYSVKMSYFKLTGVTQKIQSASKYSKRL